MDVVLDYLRKLADVAQAQGEKFRARAFTTAIASLKNYTGPMTIDSIGKIKGIGKGTLERIGIILSTGHLPEVDSNPAYERAKTLMLFQEVPGIGPKKATQLYDEGYRTLNQLPQKVLNAHQQLGIKYHNNLQIPIPRAEIDDIFDRIVDVMYRYNDTYHVDLTMMMAGSYRRGKPQSGDMDVVVASRDSTVRAGDHVPLLVDYLFAEGIMKELISKGDTKIMGICQIYDVARRIDFQIVNDVNQFWSTMLYFTGSKELNLRMRTEALKRGWKLNEHGLYDELGRRMDLFDEAEYFTALGMEYLDPTAR